jgi:hypothetical protein
MGGIAMTRRSITTTLGSLLVGLFLTVNTPAVSAYVLCEGQPDNRCEVTAAASDTGPSVWDPTQAVHILGGNGMGREHFETIEDQPGALFLIAAPTAANRQNTSGFAPEHYEQMLSRQPTN